jgi:formylglycine-generating enzyme required for sulfatase activity
VEKVSWDDAQEFIKKLNAKTGRKYRLPTETEWKFAAKGGILTHNYDYSGSNNLDDVAWTSNNSGKSTHNVGTKAPNELGIYDMMGNVREWCQDFTRYGSMVSVTTIGGSWGGSDFGFGTLHSGSKAYNLGFRLACSSE